MMPLLLQADLMLQMRLDVALHLLERRHPPGHDDPQWLAQHPLAQLVDRLIAHSYPLVINPGTP
jgi:hypothetical protein